MLNRAEHKLEHIALTGIAVSPASASVATGGTQQFGASAKDQFRAALSPQPAFTWSVVSGGVGSISSAGLYSAGSSAGSATVKAASGSVSGTAAVTVNAASPGVTDLAVYATGSGRVTLYWTALANATGYNIYRGTSSSGEDYAHPLNGSTPVNTVSYPGSPMEIYTNTGLTDGTEYFYTVKAVYSNGQSEASVEDSDVPDPAAVPWDTRSPSSVLSAVRNAYADDEPYLINLRVVGPDGLIYDDAYASVQPPDGTLDSGSNQVTLSDGTVVTMPLDPYDSQQSSASATSSGVLLPHAYQGVLLPPAAGPVRRVTSTRGFRGVQGQVTLPNSFHVQSDETANVYLGLRSATQEVDAGLQSNAGGWGLVLRINGPYAGPLAKQVPALINIPKPSNTPFRIPNGSTVSLRFYAYSTQPATGSTRLTLIVADGTLFSGDESQYSALGAASALRPKKGDLATIQMKRAVSIAQPIIAGVPIGVRANTSATLSSITVPAWDQGQLLQPGGQWITWKPAQVARFTSGPNAGRYDDGSYDGGGLADLSWTPFPGNPYFTEQNISITIHKAK